MKPRWLERALVVGPYLTLCLTEADFNRELRKIKLSRSEWPQFMKTAQADASAHLFEYKRRVCVIVCLRNYEQLDPVSVAGLLVHEAVHIWQRFCDHIGEAEPSVEFEAYSIQAISQRLMWEFVRQTKSA